MVHAPEGLRDDDAAFDRGPHVDCRIVLHESRSQRIPPAAEEHGAEKQHVEPVHNKGGAIGDELG